MQQIYRRTLILKYDFNKVTKQLYWNHISAWLFPVNLLQNTLRTSFHKNTTGRMLLYFPPNSHALPIPWNVFYEVSTTISFILIAFVINTQSTTWSLIKSDFFPAITYTLNPSVALGLNVSGHHRRCCIKKGFLKKFAKFSGQHPCRNSFLRN